MTIEKNAEHIRKRVKRISLFENEPLNLVEAFFGYGREFPEKAALNFKKDGEWHSISAEKMCDRIKRVALGLYSLGIRKGDRVAILASNSPDWTITDAGCQACGVIDVPIYTTLVPKSIAYILNDSGAKVLFVESKKRFDQIEQIISDCPDIQKIVFFEETEGVDADSVSLAALEGLGSELENTKPELIDELTSAIDPDDIATLIYTSGTTGEPKGVMLSHENLLSNAIDAGANFEMSENDIALSVLPLSHVFERTGMYIYILNRMSVFYAESIEKIPENLKEVRPTLFVGVPRVFEKVFERARSTASEAGQTKEMFFDWAIGNGKEIALANETGTQLTTPQTIKFRIADELVFSKLRDFFGGRLRFCITGGAALSDDIFLIFTGAGISIMQGYGLTETSPVITSNNPENLRLGTVGKPIRNVEVRIADDGEIEISGPNVMHGYCRKPEASKDAFSEDGWFKTGDIGEFDDDGFLKITDRKKELFKTSGGKYIAPSPIEQMIKRSRFVNQVVLIGNSRKFASALIVPNFAQVERELGDGRIETENRGEYCRNAKVIKLFEQEIEKYCEGLARFETVKKVALLANELTVEGGELTPTLKIKRRIVDEKYESIINEIYRDAEMKKPAR